MSSMPAIKRDYHSLANTLLGQRLAIDSYALHLVQLIGVGAFGVIFLANEYDGCVATCRQFAVKCLLRSSSSRHSSSSDRFILREKNLHARVRHPHVVKVYAVIEQMDLVYIVMDYYPEGDLFKAIVERQEYVGQDDQVRDAFLQIANGLRACHANGVFHRDIKPENILVRSAYSGVYPKMALADFGLATNEEYSTEFGVGSSYYMSLECGASVDKDGARQASYSSRSNDVWSLGVLLVNLTCGRNPWVRAHLHEDTFGAFMRDPDYLMKILPISFAMNELLKSVFRMDPYERCTLDELIEGVKYIDRFTLDWTELCSASETVRQAAGPLLRVREKQDRMTRLLLRPDAACSEFGVSSYGDWETLVQSYVGNRTDCSDDDCEECHGMPIITTSTNNTTAQFETYDMPESREDEDMDYASGSITRTSSDGASPDPSFLYAADGRTSPPSGFQDDEGRFVQPTLGSLYGFVVDNVPHTSPTHWAVAVDSPGLSDCGSLPSTPGGPGPMTPGNLAFVPAAQDAAAGGAVDNNRVYFLESELVTRHALGLYHVNDSGQVYDISTVATAGASKAPEGYARLFGASSPEAL